MNLLFKLEHTLYALLLTVIGYLLGYPITATWLAIAFFTGREHAQAEYKWIENFGAGKRKNMPWWATLDKRVWDFHSGFWNLSLPILFGILVLILVR